MKRNLLLIGSLLASTAALAQDGDASTARALDLRLPQAPIQYGPVQSGSVQSGSTVDGDPSAPYRADPPGTYYGDHSGRPVSAEGVPDDGSWQMHGSVGAGIGYSKQGGNSNWQAANVNLSKTYSDDDGDTNHVNLSISISLGQGEGPMFAPGYYYGPGGYGPPPPVW